MSHPSLVYVLGAVLVLFAHSRTRQLVQLFIPLVGLYFIFSAYKGPIQTFSLPVAGRIWPLLKMDPLSILFVISFLLFSLLANLFSLHTRSRGLFSAANIYTAGAIGAVLAGDLLLFFIFWEIMAVASAILVWNSRNPQSGLAVYRYLLMHGTGGLLFLAAILLKLQAGQSLQTTLQTMDVAGALLFAAICINAALVPFHAWLPDSYSAATPAGTVYLSAFTTKTAVYAFARMFPGEELLLWLGALTAVYGIIYALMEDDIRRVLSYSLVCQIGYAAIGIGIGPGLGVSAAALHAVGNIFSKGLLFMAAASLIMVTGRFRLSELKGLGSRKPFILVLYGIGFLAIAGFPGLNGYVTKALLLFAVSGAHHGWLEFLMLTASSGTYLAVGSRVAHSLFFCKARGPVSVDVLPLNCYLAMTLAAGLCVAAGIFPQLLRSFLPAMTAHQVYNQAHLLQTLECMAVVLLAFLVFRRFFDVKPQENWDIDWIYRRGCYLVLIAASSLLQKGQKKSRAFFSPDITKLKSLTSAWIPSQNISPAGNALLWILAGILFSTTAVFFLR